MKLRLLGCEPVRIISMPFGYETTEETSLSGQQTSIASPLVLTRHMHS